MRTQQKVDEFIVPRLVDSSDWVADHERSVCFVCSRPFGAFRRKHHCRMCGEIVCSGCTLHKEAVVDPALGRTRVRVCVSCLCGKAGSARRRQSQQQQQQQHSYSSEYMSPHTASSGESTRQWIQNHLHSPNSGDESSEGSDECDAHDYEYLSWSGADSYTPQRLAFVAPQSSGANSGEDAAKYESSRPAEPAHLGSTSLTASKAPRQDPRWHHAWPQPPVSRDERDRVQALHSLRIVDTAPEKPFDRICELAKARLSCPMAAVSFLDESRQWFKASTGLAHKMIPRKISLCAYTVYLKESVVVLDTRKDPRFELNPLVSGAAAVRFYAAAPIIERSTGHALGSVFVLDTRPRESCDITVLERLAHSVSDDLAARFDGASALSSSRVRERIFVGGDNNNEKMESVQQAWGESATCPRLSAQVDALAALYGVDCSDDAKLSVSTASLSSAPSFSKSPLHTCPGNNSAEESPSSCALKEGVAVTSLTTAPPMEALLMRLLTQSTETQEQLTKQQLSISHMLGQHTSQIQKLAADLARMEAKMKQATLGSK